MCASASASSSSRRERRRSVLVVGRARYRRSTSVAYEAADGPCRYFVVNRAAASDKLQAYVRSLPVERLASDAIRDVYRLVR